MSFLTVLLIRASLVRRLPAAYGSVPEFSCDFKGRMLLADASPVIVFALLTANTALFTRDNATLVARLEAATLKRQERRLSRLAAGRPFPDNRDQLERASHLLGIYLGIYKALRTLYPENPEMVSGVDDVPERRVWRTSHFSS